jgi:hypothetical protein
MKGTQALDPVPVPRGAPRCYRGPRYPGGMSTRVIRTVLGLAALTLFVSACTSASVNDLAGSAGRTRTPAGMDRAASSSPESNARSVPEVLRFSAPRLGGGRVVGADYAGRDVALWFWAPW